MAHPSLLVLIFMLWVLSRAARSPRCSCDGHPALARVAGFPSSPPPTSLLVGGRGDDHLLSFDNGSFLMKGGPGGDWLNARSGDSSTLLGGPGADVLDARAGNEGEYFVSPNPDALDGGGPNGSTGDTCFVNTNDVARGCEQVQVGL